MHPHRTLVFPFGIYSSLRLLLAAPLVSFAVAFCPLLLPARGCGVESPSRLLRDRGSSMRVPRFMPWHQLGLPPIQKQLHTRMMYEVPHTRNGSMRGERRRPCHFRVPHWFGRRPKVEIVVDRERVSCVWLVSTLISPIFAFTPTLTSQHGRPTSNCLQRLGAHLPQGVMRPYRHRKLCIVIAGHPRLDPSQVRSRTNDPPRRPGRCPPRIFLIHHPVQQSRERLRDAHADV